MKIDEEDLRMIRETKRTLKGQKCSYCSSEKVAVILWGMALYERGHGEIDERG